MIDYLKLFFVCVSVQMAVDAGQTEITSIRYRDYPAYLLTDGRTEAVVVPELGGRVMVYRRVGGENLIWTAEPSADQIKKGGFINWGGDKTLVGPHVLWRNFGQSLWPPRPSWMGGAHTAEVKKNELVTTSPVWEGFNLRTIRKYSFTEKGELKIIQIFERIAGEPREMAIWNVSQIIEPQSVYTLSNPESPYKNSYIFHNKRESIQVDEDADNEELLVTTFKPEGASKISFDSKHPVTVAKWEREGKDLFWVQRGVKDKKHSLKGSSIKTFGVEYYTHGKAKNNYVEMELMSPAFILKKDQPVTFTLFWSLHGDLDTSEILSVLNGEGPDKQPDR